MTKVSKVYLEFKLPAPGVGVDDSGGLVKYVGHEFCTLASASLSSSTSS